MKIYIDENLPNQLAHALNLLQSYHNLTNKTKIEIVSIKDEFGEGAKDEDWIPKVKGSFVITKDIRIQKRRDQRDLYLDNQIGMFYISTSSMNYWDITKLLVSHWESILKIITKQKLPFAYKASNLKSGFTKW
jgi:predicted nuclease of predicted toxin-antitoxin system